MWDVYVIDATLHDEERGLYCFCPVEFDAEGNPSGVVTGMNFLSTEPPDGAKYAGIVHMGGDGLAQKWAEDHADTHEDLKARFGFDPEAQG